MVWNMNLIDQSLAELIKENERLIKQLRIYSEGLDRIQKGVAMHHKEFDDGGSWVSKIYSEIKKKIKEIG